MPTTDIKFNNPMGKSFQIGRKFSVISYSCLAQNTEK